MDYNSFDRLLKSHNTTAYRVAKGTGIAPSTFSDWKSGRSVPKADKLRKIAAFLGVSMDTLLSEPESLPAKPLQELFGFRPLTNLNGHCQLPIIGEIRAGSPIITDETVLGYEEADVDDPTEYFYLRVRGDSMKDCGMVDGSIVLFHKQTYAEEGSVVACLVGGESATVKRFHKEGYRIFLCPENDDYTPIELSPLDFETGEARIMGVAVEIRIRNF